MLDLQIYISFILAVSILMLIPGASVAFIVANSVAHGARFGLSAVAGIVTAIIIQLIVTSLGIVTLINNLTHGLMWIKWAGVAYLIYSGVQQWGATSNDTEKVKVERRSKVVFAGAFFVSLINPAQWFFYGAFFPQFLSSEHDLSLQLLILSALFLIVSIVINSGWAILAGYAKRFLTGNAQLQNRLSGGLLFCSGVGLALARL
jgi:homoserine/homoserine lactone efflux protein